MGKRFNIMINGKNLTFLTNAKSATIHAIFYLQIMEIKVDNVIVAGEKKQYDLLKEYSEVKNFSLEFVEELNSEKTVKLLKLIKPDIMFIMCSKILDKDIIKIPKYVLNVHAGILPQYRGFDVRRWAILEEGEIGVSAHLVNEKTDMGDILITRKIKIQPGDTIQKISSRNYYHNRYIVLTRALSKLAKGEFSRKIQKPDEGRRYFYMHDKLRELVDLKLKKSEKT